MRLSVLRIGAGPAFRAGPLLMIAPAPASTAAGLQMIIVSTLPADPILYR